MYLLKTMFSYGHELWAFGMRSLVVAYSFWESRAELSCMYWVLFSDVPINLL